MAAEVMEKAALRRPSVPEETQQEVEITEGAWLVPRKKVSLLITLINSSVQSSAEEKPMK